MSNFTFLQTEWPTLHSESRRVESYIQSDPRSACFYARRTLELAVHWLYDHDRAFRPPYDNNLAALLHESSFRENVPHAIYTKAQYLRKVGNKAVHERKEVPAKDALSATVELYHILYWLARTYTEGDVAALPQQFDEKLLPPPLIKVARQSIKQLKQRNEELKSLDEEYRKKQQENEELIARNAALQAQIATQKAANQAIDDTHDYSEAETRGRIIDIMLQEAGWDPHGPNVPEYPVTGMPVGKSSSKGNGYVDYVLWGDDGLPLGLVEAKRTSVDSTQGQQQAKLYADCLQAMHGQRPIIFYSNGYSTYLWDDERYPPRQVQGFYTKDQLMLLIQRREMALDLAKVPIKEAIVNRYYQEAAIRQMTEHFGRAHRKGLLVMATGAGKTRVAIALVDLLMAAGWVKRVLFLADRSALVKQATGAFKAHLPISNPVNLLDAGGKAQAPNARVVVSTYHTMMNLIDAAAETGKEASNQTSQKLFSVGHFDLILIDEAHRSVYQKFGAIFAYFDSLLVGLTATPKDDVDRNTYRLFDLEDGVPTDFYELEQAIADEYLVPYRAYELPTKFIQQGIKYGELSDEEKVEWELLDWGDSEEMPDEVNAAAINAWLFNEDTVDQILKTVMEHGIKVAGGDQLGKTIIFAKNHKHAAFIEERFNIHYPHYRGAFARVIDNTVNKVESLIEDFSNPKKVPHIAISVDMLDTGIDVPEVVNLLFFKVVRSKTKFFQMIGRGTRLCPEIFGPGSPENDKREFYIFDACLNFDFFDQNPEGARSSQPEPLSQSLFKKRLDLLVEARRLATTDPDLAPLAKALADTLHSSVAAMNIDNFIVRPQRAYVDPFQSRTRWENLNRVDVAQLSHYVSGLPTTQKEEIEPIKRFDLMVLDLQLAYLSQAERFNTLRNHIIDLAANLETKVNIPRVHAQLEFLQEIQTERFWKYITLPRMDEIRQRLRDLVVHADKSKRQVVYTAFKDAGGKIREAQATYGTAGVNEAQYKRKVEKFIRDHEEYVVIQKIRWGIRLTMEDLQALEQFFYEAEAVGGQAQFVQIYGQQENLAAFIRSLVGLDRGRAKERFAQFLDGQSYTAEQIRFVNYIIDHLTANGAIAPSMLYDQPYTDIHYQGLTGLFTDDQAKALLDVVQAVNAAVDVASSTR